MDKTYFYDCYFTRYYAGQPYTAHTKVPSIASVMAGFWINKDGEHTVGEDRRHWIAPAVILYVDKVDLING